MNANQVQGLFDLIKELSTVSKSIEKVCEPLGFEKSDTCLLDESSTKILNVLMDGLDAKQSWEAYGYVEKKDVLGFLEYRKQVLGHV